MAKNQTPISFFNSFVILATSALITFLVATFLPAAEEQAIPENILLGQEMCGKNRKGPVEFSHLNHIEDYGLSCEECHHDYMDSKNVWKEGDWVNKCTECHDACKSDGNVKKLKVAFHKNCIDCHRKIKAEWGSTDAPFRDCRGCHKS